ncbi:MAG TPA: hypothetical protein VG841_07300 [Caulobacterales bacterium]|nr:hypothetical protein [Caulobacterales bacterium]
MHVHDHHAAHARRQVDPRDRPTQEHRADKPQEPDRQTVDLGQAVAQAADNHQDETVNPGGIGDRLRDQNPQRGRLIDIRV